MNLSLFQNSKLFVLLFLFTFGLIASDAPFLTPQEELWIKEHPVVVLGADYRWPPYDFVDSRQQHSGIASDFLALISQKSGLKFEVRPGIWSEVMEKMRAGKLDGLTSAVATPQREAFLNFTTPYTSMPMAIVVQDGRSDIHTIADLDGKVVAVNKNSYLQEWLERDYPGIRLYPTNSNDASLEAVSFSHADAYIGNVAVATYIIKEKYLSNLKIVNSVPNMQTDVSVAIDKKQPLLFSIVEKTLATISQEERNTITERWFTLSKADSEALSQESRVGLSAEEKTWILQHKNVRVGADPDWPPFDFVDEKGEYVGISADYLALISKKTGLVFSVEPYANWEEVLNAAREKRLDLLACLSVSEEREKFLDFTVNYLNYAFVLATMETHGFVQEIDDFNGKRVGVVKGYITETILRDKYPKVHAVIFKDVSSALDALVENKIDAFFDNDVTIAYAIGKKGYTHVKIAMAVNETHSVHMGVVKSNPMLLSILNKALKSITQEEKKTITNRWFSFNYVKRTDYRLLVQIVLVLGFFILGTLYWNRKLRREISVRKRIEHDLQVEKENFKRLFEKSSDGNLIISKGKIVNCNAAVSAMLGLQGRDEIIGSTLQQWSPPYQDEGLESNEKLESMIRSCLDEGRRRFEWILQDRQGNRLWVDMVLTKISYEGRIAIYGVWRDITEQKQLENSLKTAQFQTEQLIDNIPLNVIVSTYDGRVLRANPHSLDEYKVKAEELYKYNIMDFYVNMADRDSVIETIRKEGRVDQRIVSLRGSDRSETSVLLSVIPIDYGGQKALLSITVDITKRIEMEQALTRAKDAADAASRSKSEFLANMSHEIRTPMNAIIGFTELLSEQIHETRLKSYVKTIQSAGNSLLMLINDILDLSKIEAGKLQLNKMPTNLFELCDEIGAIFMMTVRNKGLDLVIDVDKDIPKSLLIDDIRLRQILVNLIGNAVKFTEKGYIKLKIEVSSIYEHQSKLDMKIFVEDSGVGIPDDQLHRIFNAFEQKEGQESRKFGGTGLGLSISKRLCEAMGGSISVKSTEGKGTTFTVQLSGIDISSIQQHSTTKEEKGLDIKRIVFSPAKILIVDDVDDNRDLIVRIFEGSAVKVVTASNGLEAIEQYKTQSPDLILMDIRMPKMDGYAAAEAIKKLGTVPIIALTASVMKDEYARLKMESFDAHLRKPVLKNELFSTLSHFLDYTIADVTNSEEDAFELSEKAKANLGLILGILAEDISPMHKRVLKNNNIAEIKALASKLRAVALQYEISFMERYATALYEAINVFDIAKMQQLLQEYPKIEEKMRAL